MQQIELIAKFTSLPVRNVENTIQLLDEGGTIPFIARYRKERTGSLDEVAIAAIKSQLAKVRELTKRKESILKSIEEQGKLTPGLRNKIESTWDATQVEDLYLPYKKKRKTRATTAREKGLEPLATIIFEQRNSHIDRLAQQYLNDEVKDVEEALQGARDIIAEWVNENEKARNTVRFSFEKGAVISAKVARGKKEEGEKFKDYFDYQERLSRCPSHRLLAIRRGEDEGILRVSIAPDESKAIYHLERLFLKGYGAATQQVKLAVEDAYKRLLSASIETEFRNSSKLAADEEAIRVFAENLRQLLLTAPLGQKKILAIDPGYRTGCKVVCLDESGNLLYHTAIYPHPPQSQKWEASDRIQQLTDKYKIEAIAIGNGTAGRETLSLVKGISFEYPVEVFMVNESGASIYSASEIAREEFPDYDVTVRGAVSIGRRLMDPLAELVKIDPKSIGVGQYQHDVNQTMLKNSLDLVVESCVNSVGINLNTASKHLLTYVSGLGPVLAGNIVSYRKQQGGFKSRLELKKVPRLGEKAFEQCAGFLRITTGRNPLDNTAVHPERYQIVNQMATDLKCSVQELIQQKEIQKSINLKQYIQKDLGLPTLKDILTELDKPGLDPRGQAKVFEFSNEVKTIDDLKEGMILPGIVTNITNFGAFVDIGVKQDGLVHVSQLTNRFVKDPAEVVKLNQAVKVKVTSIDLKRNRIQLSMKEV